MSTDSGTPSPAPANGGRRHSKDALRWVRDPQAHRLRAEAQLAAIIDGLGPDRLQVATAGGDETRDLGAAAYLVRRTVVLAPIELAPRVSGMFDKVGVEHQLGEPDERLPGVVEIRVPDALAALRRLQDTEYAAQVAPDHVLHLTPGPTFCPATEPLPPHRTTPSPGVRRAHRGCDGEGVRIAVVDSGFDPGVAAQTPWLAGVTGDAETLVDPLGPYLGHGTFVAGVVRTVAPRAEVHVHGVFPEWGADFEVDIVRKLHDALKTAPDIVSLSAGTTTYNTNGLLALDSWWAAKAPPGSALIAAAGNNGDTVPFYPAAGHTALSVGALTRKGNRAAYSNHGRWVDVYALGSHIVNAYPVGTYRYAQPPKKGAPDAVLDTGLAMWSGTSFSTPLVAGVVAARMSGSGLSAAAAVRELRLLAEIHRRPCVGPIVTRSMACR